MTAEESFDVVVVGSGAAGMTAALTAADQGLSVLVIEKAERFGGSTARSGGGIWVPNNAVLLAAGVPDTPEQAEKYLAHIVDGAVPAARRAAFLEHGPRMVDLVRQRTPLRFAWSPEYSDYYPEAPGGMPQGRSIEPRPTPARILGERLGELEPPYLKPTMGIAITAADYRWMNLMTRHRRGRTRVLRVGARLVLSKVLRRPLLTLGQALAAGLRAGLAAAGVPVRLGTPMVDLITEDGRVTGVLARHGETEVRLLARRGVVLTSGGFERNAEMRKRYQKEPIGADWTVGAAANEGDGIEAGHRLGAALDLMDDAWWGPSIPLSGGPYFCLSERSLPGSLIVNGAGERYVNEAAPYVDAVHAMYDGHAAGVPHVPSWLVFDQGYRNRYTFCGLPPRQRVPRRWQDAGAVLRADTIEELAAKIDVPAGALRATVERFNGYAGTGKDAEFRRGDSAYDRYYGDPTIRPNPCLAALTEAPFYAAKIVPGDLGTKGGLVTDEHARVRREDGSVIEGLYAAGNASASVMGHTYAGAGATLGPAMTFGYIAALGIAGASADTAATDSASTDSGGNP